MKKIQTLDVKCEACGSEGTIAVSEGERVNCPDCGAGYIAWRPPWGNKIVLKCVVRPVFKRAD